MDFFTYTTTEQAKRKLLEEFRIAQARNDEIVHLLSYGNQSIVTVSPLQQLNEELKARISHLVGTIEQLLNHGVCVSAFVYLKLVFRGYCILEVR